MVQSAIRGISDISSTEGKLWRYIRLCTILKSTRRPSKERLIDSLRPEIRIDNRKVIERHLLIAQKLGLIDSFGGVYTLSSDGKVLCELAQEVKEKLTLEQSMFFFTLLFSSLVREQLVLLIKVIRNNRGGDKKQIILDYFSTPFAYYLWDRNTITKNLSRLKECGKISAFLYHKFSCMVGWLKDLGLVYTREGKLYLSLDRSSEDAIEGQTDIRNHIYSIAAKVYVQSARNIDYQRDRKLFYETIKQSTKLFKVEHENLSDIRAVRRFLCIHFLTKSIIIEEHEFDNAIKKLWSKGLVRSVMLGRDGKPAHLLLTDIT